MVWVEIERWEVYSGRIETNEFQAIMYNLLYLNLENSDEREKLDIRLKYVNKAFYSVISIEGKISSSSSYHSFFFEVYFLISFSFPPFFSFSASPFPPPSSPLPLPNTSYLIP